MSLTPAHKRVNENAAGWDIVLGPVANSLNGRRKSPGTSRCPQGRSRENRPGPGPARPAHAFSLDREFLLFIQGIEKAILLHELGKRPFLNYAALVRHQYPVHSVEMHHPVSGHENRHLTFYPTNRLVYDLLVGNIEGAGGLVEQHRLTFRDKRPRYSDPVFLPIGRMSPAARIRSFSVPGQGAFSSCLSIQ